MDPVESYLKMKSQARIDGGWLGLFWIASFVCFIGNFKNPLLGFAWMAFIVLTPFVVASRVRRYRDRELEGIISFGRAYGHSFFIFFYGSLILAIVQWAYFQFLDHGFLIDQYIQLFESDDWKKISNRLPFNEVELKHLTEQLRSLRPIDITFQLLWSNVLISALASLFIALFTKRSTPSGNAMRRPPSTTVNPS